VFDAPIRLPDWNEPSDLATRPHRYRKAEESGHGAAVAGIGVDW